jgi:hypothetical protein
MQHGLEEITHPPAAFSLMSFYYPHFLNAVGKFAL